MIPGAGFSQDGLHTCCLGNKDRCNRDGGKTWSLELMRIGWRWCENEGKG